MTSSPAPTSTSPTRIMATPTRTCRSGGSGRATRQCPLVRGAGLAQGGSCFPTAAAAARRFVRDTLQTWLISGATIASHGLIDDAVLLTSELVTNAVVHAGTPVEVTCKLAGGGVEVVVSDSHPVSLVPEPPEHEHIPAERPTGYRLLPPPALPS